MGKGANSMGVSTFEDTAKRVHNFSAGPACLPESVMRTAAAEFCGYGGSGIGMMEMSHRDPGGPVQNAMSQAAGELRSLLSVPDAYHVLFMHGGAHGQVRGEDFLSSLADEGLVALGQRSRGLDFSVRGAGVVPYLWLLLIILTSVYSGVRHTPDWSLLLSWISRCATWHCSLRQFH